MNLKILNLLQFPWRFLSILIFIPPIIVSYALKNFKYRILIGLFLAGSLIMFRGAQVYGKNYTISKNYEYFHPQVNHYSNLLSPVWVGRIEEYPNKYYKGEAPGNDGEFIDRIEKNDYRSYTIQASDKILLVDNTFYYPGWKVYIDGIPTEIQFQHEKFRGMITYIMPRGIHNILVVFEQTKIRKIADLISSVTFFLFVVVGSLNIFKKKLNNI